MQIRLVVPPGYVPLLSPRETERAIRLIKEFFQTNLAFELNLMRVTAPIFVRAGTGINDDLNGVERPVSFLIKDLDSERAEVVQSLAKWKRLALDQLGLGHGEGVYTDMNAIRPDETLDNLHSLYVDQWDWELVISREERSIEFLKAVVRKIYEVIKRTERYVAYQYGAVTPFLPGEIAFIHSEELDVRYPGLTPREREYQLCREHGAVFIIGIGYDLAGGMPHDGRAPDYDDWSTPSGGGRRGLNGDILVYYPLRDCAYELSSMGIRVDREALMRQLEIRNALERVELPFHRRLLNGELPLSIGGGIGQSRLCMLYLRKAHIGEIQASIWPEEMIDECARSNIFLL